MYKNGVKLDLRYMTSLFWLKTLSLQGYEDAKQELRSKIVNDIKRQKEKQTYIEVLQIYDEMGMIKASFRGRLQEYINSLEEE